MRVRCHSAGFSSGFVAAISRPSASAGSAQSSTVTGRAPGQVAFTAQVAAPVPPPMST